MLTVISLLVLLAGIKYSGKGRFNSHSFTQNQTNSLKGLCAIYVVFHHLYPYLGTDFPSLKPFEHIGYLMVGCFFMISGYGLMYGISNKPQYLTGFFSKRILAILVPYYIINIFYIYANHLSKSLNIRYIIRSIFGFNLWYVMAITIFYMAFYLCFRLFGKKHGTFAISIFTLLYISLMYIMYTYFNYLPFGFWWYNSAICFPLGIWYCALKEKIDIKIQNHYLVSLSIIVLLFIATFVYSFENHGTDTFMLLIDQILCSALFCLLLLILSMKFQISNPVLNFCGKHSLELYLSHALFIFAFRSDVSVFGITININNKYLYLVAILASTIIFSYAVHFISSKILKAINKKEA